MYRINVLTIWLKKQIKKEQDSSYKAIYSIILGLAVGLFAGFLSQDVAFSSVITKIGGLGISITTIVSVFYYLHKYDEIETRKSDFLTHISDVIDNQEDAENHEDKALYLSEIKPEILQDIIIDILKNKITETTSSPQ
ncbi:hypothetical protein QTN47_15005 [Danxiaibacter flavus]|uniref:DUF4231 domain-containing protein n=1 Tax=Danxiaibacter flavus TaxID=3049108 RepID=A0ABV3ZI38_9BACT|nr:hypothetical protein QNM32_15015 [Chitinophagaceae bacterium DXS]